MSTLRSATLQIAKSLPKGHPTRRALLAALKQARGVHVALKELPKFLVKILATGARYKRKDIEVIPATKVTVGIPAFEGNRSYVIVVNLGTQRHEIVQGDWSGGAGTSAVDRGGSLPVPSNGAVIVGEYGGRGSFARIFVNPDNLATLIPEKSDDKLTEDEKYALTYINIFNSRGRKDAFREKRLGTYAATNPLVQSLASKGLVAVRGRAVQVTTKGKNVRKSLPRKYEYTW